MDIPVKRGRKPKVPQDYFVPSLFTSKRTTKQPSYQGNNKVHHHPAEKYASADLKKAAKEHGVPVKTKKDAIEVLKEKGQEFPVTEKKEKKPRKTKQEKEQDEFYKYLFKDKSTHPYQGNNKVHHHPAEKYASADLKKAAKEHGVPVKTKKDAIEVLKEKGQEFPVTEKKEKKPRKTKQEKEQDEFYKYLFKDKSTHPYQGNNKVHHHPAEKYASADLKKAAKEHGVPVKTKKDAIEVLKEKGQEFPVTEKKEKKPRKPKVAQDFFVPSLFTTKKTKTKKT